MEVNRFSVDTKCFATITKENRLRILDTQTRKEKHSYNDNKHLNSTYTCFTWGQSSSPSSSSSSSRDRDGVQLGYVAIGSREGNIIIWDLLRGVIKKVIQLGENCIPTDVCFTVDLNSILVSSNANTILQFNTNTGEQTNSFKGSKRGVTALCMSPAHDSFAFGRYMKHFSKLPFI